MSVYQRRKDVSAQSLTWPSVTLTAQSQRAGTRSLKPLVWELPGALALPGPRHSALPRDPSGRLRVPKSDFSSDAKPAASLAGLSFEGRGQEPTAWRGVPKRDCPRLPTCEIPDLCEISNRDFQGTHLNLFTPVLVLRTCLMGSLPHSKGSSGYLPCSTFWVCRPDRA